MTNPGRSLVFTVIAEMAAFSITTAALRLSAENLSVFQTTFIRYAICALLIAPLSLFRGARYTSQDVKRHVKRSLLIYMSAIFWTYAIITIPLSLALFIFYLKTILLCLLSSQTGHAPSRIEWFAVVTGIVGVLFVVGPLPGSSSPLGMAAAFLSALSSSFIASETKYLGATGTSTSAALMATTIIAILSLPLASFYWITPSYNAMIFISISSLFTVISQCLLFYSYSYLSITKIAIIEFGRFLCIAIVGALAFHENLDFVSIVGLVLIAGCIIFGLMAWPAGKAWGQVAEARSFLSALSRVTPPLFWKRHRS